MGKDVKAFLAKKKEVKKTSFLKRRSKRPPFRK